MEMTIKKLNAGVKRLKFTSVPSGHSVDLMRVCCFSRRGGRIYGKQPLALSSHVGDLAPSKYAANAEPRREMT
jgi:hypothetical protein